MKKTQIRGAMLLLGFLVAGVGIAQAATIPLTNPSFEDPVISGSSYAAFGEHGWAIGKPTGGETYIGLAGASELGSCYPQGAQDGANVMMLNGPPAGSTWRGQSMGTVEAGETYTISAYVTALVGYSAPGYGVYLWDNDSGGSGDCVGGVSDVAAWQAIGMDAGASPTAGVWNQVSFSMLIPSARDGHAVTLYLATDLSTADSWIAFDNVVPEPTTLGLLVIGGGLSLLRRRRR